MRLDFDRRTKEEIARRCGFDEHVRLGQVFDLLWRGYSIVQISMTLGMSPATVSRSIREIKRRMSASIYTLHLYIQMITPLPDGRGFF